MEMASQGAAVVKMHMWIPLLLAACSEFSLNDTDETVADSMVVEESFLHETEQAIDILLVIDNTASMRTELEQLQTQIPNLLEGLEHSNTAWQLGAITTDVISEHAAMLQGDPWVITPTTPEPEAALLQMTDVGHEGNGPEAGLAAALWALSPPLVDEANRGIRRNNAALHIVIVSDGDDHSHDWLEEDSTSVFERFLTEQSSSSGEPASFSAIVGPTPNGCISSIGTAQAGVRYLNLADATNGYTGSICELDLTPFAQWLGETSQSDKPRFVLQARPRAGTIRVQVNDARWDDGWALVDGSIVEFDSKPPAGAEIRIRYEVQSS